MAEESQDKLGTISAAYMQADTDDLQALAMLHQQFESLMGELAEPDAEALVQKAMDLLQQVILDETQDAAGALEQIGQLTRQLQGATAPPPTEDDESASAHYQIPPTVDAGIVSSFLGRQASVLEEMEALSLAIERGDDPDAVAELRRLVHTLKGEAALLDMTDAQQLCHALETALENGAASALADVLLQVKDYLASYFAACGQDQPLPARPVALLQTIERAEAGSPAAAGAMPPADTPDPAAAVIVDPDLISDFISEANEHLDQADEQMLALEADPTREEALAAVFRGFHTIKGVAGFLQLGDIKQVAHEAETMLDAARRGDLRLEGPSLEAAFEAVDVLRHLVAEVAAAATENRAPAPSDRVAPLLERLAATNGHDSPAGSNGPIATPESASPTPRPASAPADHPAGTGRAATSGVKELIKIDAERLDHLIDTIGELVIAEAMISRSGDAGHASGSDISRQLGRVSKITRELQELGMSLRMVPMRSTFQKMARLARDLSKKLNKPLDFVLHGEDTELDKSVVDQIGDPLIHLVRNAVDHGLEPDVEQRRAAGKPDSGRIELRAYHQGGEVIIEIVDDGRGLNRENILRKARERGLVANDANLTDEQVYALIFSPGFSTAAQVTDVSGRGVGLDVVAQNIEALRGRTEIQSTPGQGSIFRLRLPLTLAIIDGMVLRVDEQRYVLPTLTILRMIHPEPAKLRSILHKGEMLETTEGLVPLIRLEELLHGGTAARRETSNSAVVVVIESAGRRVGLLADELLGQQQVVIKPLGSALSGTPGLSGGAIMADGRVGLVIDAAGLIRSDTTERGSVAAAA